MDIGTRKIYVLRPDPVKSILPKGTLSPIDIVIRTIYGSIIKGFRVGYVATA